MKRPTLINRKYMMFRQDNNLTKNILLLADTYVCLCECVSSVDNSPYSPDMVQSVSQHEKFLTGNKSRCDDDVISTVNEFLLPTWWKLLHEVIQTLQDWWTTYVGCMEDSAQKTRIWINKTIVINRKYMMFCTDNNVQPL